MGDNAANAPNANAYAVNLANDFLQALARENHTSAVQAQLLLARKIADRSRTAKRIARLEQQIRQKMRILRTEKVVLENMNTDILRLQGAVNTGYDDNVQTYTGPQEKRQLSEFSVSEKSCLRNKKKYKIC